MPILPSPSQPSAEEWRLFIALIIPEPVRSGILEVQSFLRGVLPGNQVRWTRPDQFHLTLKFLGNVPVARVGALTQAVRGACGGSKPFLLQAAQVGFFPEHRAPRVIWVGIQDEGDAPLARLQTAVWRSVQEFTREPAESPFAGHVTVGRIKGIRRAEAEMLARSAASLAGRQLGRWTAERVDIVRSELTPSGAKYRTLTQIAL